MGAVITCTGQGDNGGHCCWIDGTVCSYLVEVDGLPRCGKLIELGSWEAVKKDRNWRRSKVGKWFKRIWPGEDYGCGDWPQNIPDVPGGRCCWQADEQPVEIG